MELFMKMIFKGNKKGDHYYWRWKTFGNEKREAWKFDGEGTQVFGGDGVFLHGIANDIRKNY
jgi:hypothetical protein